MPRLLRVPVVALALLVGAVACTEDEDLELDATIGAHPSSAIAAVLEVTTSEPASLSVEVEGPGGGFTIPETDEATSHRIPVVGMRAESAYRVTVTGGDEAVELEWTTGALPADLPPVSLEQADAARMAPGYTLFNAFGWDPVPQGQPAPDAGYVLAVDADGEVVWYQRLRHQLLDVDTTPRGTFLATAGDSVIQEFDLFGAVVREWATKVATEYAVEDLQGRVLADEGAMPVDIDSAHHEVTELANGNVITLSTEVVELDGALAAEHCPDNPEATIVADVVVELSPEGEVLREWPLTGVYDPAEVPGAEMCIQGPPVAPPNWFYPGHGLTRDWSHANAVELDEARNTLIVSARHFDQIFGIRYEEDDDGPAGELLWSLGVDGTLDLDGEPPYHQHAMELVGDDRVVLYDNGNFRPGTSVAVGGGDAPPFSRAVEYELDLEAGTARQVWEHRDAWADGRPVYTPFLGDVDTLPNDNVLVTHGGGSSAAGGFQAKIVEVVRGDAADGSDDEVVFDLVIGTGEAREDGAPTGWSVYRSMRLPSLYFAT